MVQGSGSGFLVSNSGKSFQIGSYILISGLALQVTAFAFFTITAIRFDIKYKREFGLDGRERYVALLYCLYVSCLCILVSFYFVHSVFILFSPGLVWFAGVYPHPSTLPHPPRMRVCGIGVGLGACGCLPYFHISLSLFFSFSSRFHWGMYLRTPAPLITWSRVAKWPSTQREGYPFVVDTVYNRLGC